MLRAGQCEAGQKNVSDALALDERFANNKENGARCISEPPPVKTFKKG
jgi:hypothetical protein